MTWNKLGRMILLVLICSYSALRHVCITPCTHPPDLLFKPVYSVAWGTGGSFIPDNRPVPDIVSWEQTVLTIFYVKKKKINRTYFLTSHECASHECDKTCI